MKVTSISKNPERIGDTLGGRGARYVAWLINGVASPAIWYWSTARGDKAFARRSGLGRKDCERLHGWRIESGTLVAMCVLPTGHWYTAPVTGGQS